MPMIEKIIIISVSIIFLSMIGILFFLIQAIKLNKKKKKLNSKKVRNKKRKKRIRSYKKYLEKRRRKVKKNILIVLAIVLIFTTISVYLSYYQATHLSKDDIENVVNGYYLIDDFEQQLTLARSKKDDEEQLQKNVRYLATSMASYGTKKANTLNNEKGQKLLNRYYQLIKQLGMNVSPKVTSIYGNEELSNLFISDVQKVKQVQNEVMNYYKIQKKITSTFEQKK